MSERKCPVSMGDVVRYFEANPGARISDCADSLGVDLSMMADAVRELREIGVLAEIGEEERNERAV